MTALTKALKREVSGGHHGPLVVHLSPDAITLRPKGTRVLGPASISIPWSALFQLLHQRQADALRARGRPARRR